MAAISNPLRSSFSLKNVVGADEGAVSYKTDTFNRVFPTADDENILNVASILFGLSEYGFGTIVRTDKGEILEDD